MNSSCSSTGAGGWEELGLNISQMNAFSRAISFCPKPGSRFGSSWKVRDWWAPASGAVVHRECLLSREDRRSWVAVPSFWVIATLWITKAIGFLQTSLQFGFSWRVHSGSGWLVFVPKMIPVCSATPNFSACSSFMILMRVFFFFQETHISLFDLGASVRIFF